MKRLAFRIPEFSPRITWTSAQAQLVWAPRLPRVSGAFVEAERQAVIAGLRPSALQVVAPEALTDLAKAMAAHGLVVLPLGKVARGLTYTSATQMLRPNEPYDWRVAITQPSELTAWSKAWEENNDEMIGGLLGYPRCCREFFQRVWVKEHWFDTTGPMVHGLGPYGDAYAPAVRGTNMLLRWFGVRPVSHLPCAFGCPQTAEIAVLMLALLPQPERTWSEQMLSWPARWSSLHGIAEIFTPVFRAIVATDALASKVEVFYEGTGYPDEGATGLTFPYRRERPRPARRNGFVSDEAMQAAHAVLLQALPNRSFGTVIDLGCGDGELLRHIAATRRVGVERDEVIDWVAGIDRLVKMDCTNGDRLGALLQEERPDLVIAQRDRNPPTQFECDVLSYSYEGGTVAQYIRGRVTA